MKRFIIAGALGILVLTVTHKAVASAVYADWTLDASGNSGTGTFNQVGGLPNFSFTITGEHIPSSSQIDDNDDFDNSPWEAIFGEGDDQESLRFKSDGEDPGGNDALTISTLTISFSSSVADSSLWGFAMTHLEGEDSVISASRGGIAVDSGTVANWFQGLFDSKPNDGETNLPSGFDAANVAIVAEFDADGILSDENLNLDTLRDFGTESASAWFLPDTEIDTLVISHRNRYGGGASMHVYMAAAFPLPAGAWMGLALLGGIGSFGFLRHRNRSH